MRWESFHTYYRNLYEASTRPDAHLVNRVLDRIPKRITDNKNNLLSKELRSGELLKVAKLLAKKKSAWTSSVSKALGISI